MGVAVMVALSVMLVILVITMLILYLTLLLMLVILLLIMHLYMGTTVNLIFAALTDRFVSAISSFISVVKWKGIRLAVVFEDVGVTSHDDAVFGIVLCWAYLTLLNMLDY